MNERELWLRIASRTGASEEDVRRIVREFFPQAFAMALEKGGTQVVPHFATFKCSPRGSGGMKFEFRPRTPGELATAARARAEKLRGRRTSRGPAWSGLRDLDGEPYRPRPVPAPNPAGETPRGRQREFSDPPRKRGFFARLFGLGE